MSGTTRSPRWTVADGWSAQVKSDGTNSNDRTDVRFTESSTRDRVELRYEPGRTEIKYASSPPSAPPPYPPSGGGALDASAPPRVMRRKRTSGRVG